MSKDIVKSERNNASFQEVEKGISALGVPMPTLNSLAPMPLSFAGQWDDVKAQVNSAIANNDPAMQTVAGKSVGFSRRRVKLIIRVRTGLGQSKVVGLASSLGALGGTGLFFILGVPELFGSAVGLLSGAFIGLAMMGFAEFDEPKLNNFFSALDSGYEQRVAQWAQERYGVTLLNRWGNPGDRLADDIIYVGEKDGQKVYCQEGSDGWILTYKDGTELPVLAKELMSA